MDCGEGTCVNRDGGFICICVEGYTFEDNTTCTGKSVLERGVLRRRVSFVLSVIVFHCVLVSVSLTSMLHVKIIRTKQCLPWK